MNVINDPWLFVEYLDGTKTQVSVRQAFIDAEKIKNIDTPIFHNTKVYIYEVPVIQLLVTILEAVYFKPETNFAAHNIYFVKNLLKNDWDEKLILNYLDKWQDRFNLFDDKYPFMQDIRLKSYIKPNKKSNLNYISNASIIAPAGKNSIFENNDSINDINYLNKYKLDDIELIYALLYNRALGASPMPVNYPHKSLCANATMFLFNFGDNLKETIINNCYPLRSSDNDLDLFDRPAWELDNIDNISNYFIESISKNVLLCSFFPSLLIYVVRENNTIINIILSQKENDFILDKETRKNISDKYCFFYPWGIIKNSSNDNEISIDNVKYKEWNKHIKLMNLCIDITKHLPNGYLCRIISNSAINDNSKSIIYYREYNDKKTFLKSYGKYEVNQNILTILQDDINHEKAVQFQDIIKKISNKFNEFNNSGISNYIIDKCKLEFSKYAEQYFFNTFVFNITDDNIINNTINILIKYAKNQIRDLDSIINNPLKYAMAYKKFSGSLNKLKEMT